jgi:hypothetical protein
MTNQKYESPNIVLRAQAVDGSEYVPNSLYSHDVGLFTVEQIEAMGFTLQGGFEALDEQRDAQLHQFLWDDFYKQGGKTFVLTKSEASGEQ